MPYPYPEAFVKSIGSLLGPETPAFFDALHQDAPPSIRLNPMKVRLAPDLPRVPWAGNGYYLPEKPLFTADPLFHAGGYYVQEASSMFLEAIFGQLGLEGRQLAVLDLCAAPGGKSGHLLSLISPDSLLVSNEAIRSRVPALKENLIKWGFPNLMITHNDPRDFRELEGFFDLILVDAPCSGEGMFRKSESVAGEWSEENVRLCSRRQQRILADVWASLKPGGYLVYSTCTYNSAENEENLSWMEQTLGAEAVQLRLPPEWNITETVFPGAYGYRFYPHRTPGEGYFAGVVRKTSGPEGKPEGRKVRVKAGDLPASAGKGTSTVKSWFFEKPELAFFQNDHYIKAIPEAVKESCIFLMRSLNCHHSGIVVAEQFHGKLKPSPWLAHSVCLDKSRLKTVACGREEALRYLRKDPVPLTAREEGHHLFTYRGAGMGWGNRVGNRWNNLFPQEWRIRMDYDELEKRKFELMPGPAA